MLILFLNWDNDYPIRDRLANQDALAQDNYSPEQQEYSLSYNNHEVVESEGISEPEYGAKSMTVVEDVPEHVEVEIHDTEIDALDALLISIKDAAGLGLSDIDQRVNSEVEFLNYLDRSPHMLNSILDRYEQFPEGKTKDLLRALLATSGNIEIELHAIEQITTGELTETKDWLVLLRDRGIHTAQGRDIMLNQLQQLSEPEALSNTLLAIAPQLVAASEKQVIIDQLAPYINHSDENVRDAAIVSLSRWADSDQSYILEQALTDTSEQVRLAAVSAAFTSRIKSETIKAMLLDIMRDDNENWSLRIDAHYALSGYTLQGKAYDDFYQFHQKQTENININEVRG